jgi:peptidoglycan/LPS O-acetylase OafA/YrhL
MSLLDQWRRGRSLDDTPREAPSPALASLTSVRFFLALGVVLFHLQLTWSAPTAEVTGLFTRARLGVEGFFILSGFVLSYVYTASVAAGRYSHGRFLVARLARIYPAHLAVLLLMGGVAGVALLLGAEFDPSLYSADGFLRTLLLVHAWLPTEVPFEWNGPSWSLSAEWFAYLLFPIFAWVAVPARSQPGILLAVSVALFLGLDYGYRSLIGGGLLTAEFNLGVLRIIPSFLAGVSLQLLSERHAPAAGPARLLAAAAAVLLLGLMHVLAPEPMVLVAAGLLILALAWLSKARADGVMAWRPLVFLGEASYAVYLLHLPMLVIWKNARAEIFGGESSYVMSMGEAGAYLVLVLAAGAVMHVIIEQPFRRWIRARWLGPTPRGQGWRA